MMPGPIVAGPEVKTMIREAELTKHPSNSPTATDIATPVDRNGR